MARSDRRKDPRFTTSLELQVRFLQDGTPIEARGIEVGPNGIRILTKVPLVEASYVLISFVGASNHTHAEGRIVWTQPSEDKSAYESGIDIQRWGGDIPGKDVMEKMPKIHSRSDRRNKTR